GGESCLAPQTALRSKLNRLGSHRPSGASFGPGSIGEVRPMRALPLARMAAVGVAAAALLHASCGDSGPSSSTPPTTIARPSPSPTLPTGGDPFHDASCTFGPGDPEAECARNRAGAEDLQSEYESAIDLLAQQQPNIFDMHDQSAPDTRTYKVLDKDAYLNGLVR